MIVVHSHKFCMDSLIIALECLRILRANISNTNDKWTDLSEHEVEQFKMTEIKMENEEKRVDFQQEFRILVFVSLVFRCMFKHCQNATSKSHMDAQSLI